MKRIWKICKKCSNFKKSELRGQYLCLIDDLNSSNMQMSVEDASDVPESCSYRFEHLVFSQSNRAILSKDICKKCHKQHNMNDWETNAEFKWNYTKSVLCPIWRIVRTSSKAYTHYHQNRIFDPPPEECKYKLEQLLFSEKAN